MLAARRHCRQHPLHEPAPVRAIGPAADPTPDHRVAQGPFHRIVRGLDPREGPQTLFHLEYLVARRRRPRATAPRTFRKGLLDLRAQAAHLRLERAPLLQSPNSHPVPPAEQLIRDVEQLPADRLGDAATIDHRLKVTTRMHHPNAIDEFRTTLVIPCRFSPAPTPLVPPADPSPGASPRPSWPPSRRSNSMRRKSRQPRPPGWAIHSVFVPRRGGLRRLEQAFRALLDANPGAGGIPTPPDQEVEPESRRPCRVSTEREGRDQTIDIQLEAPAAGSQSTATNLNASMPPSTRATPVRGSRLDRPALDRLNDAAREGEFDVLAVHSPDRLARRYASGRDGVPAHLELEDAEAEISTAGRSMSGRPSARSSNGLPPARRGRGAASGPGRPASCIGPPPTRFIPAPPTPIATSSSCPASRDRRGRRRAPRRAARPGRARSGSRPRSQPSSRNRRIRTLSRDRPSTRCRHSATTTCSRAGAAAWRCSAHHPRRARPGRAPGTTSASARTPWPATASVAAPGLRRRLGGPTRPSGARQGVARGPGDADRTVRMS